jgi:hypothetical protein
MPFLYIRTSKQHSIHNVLLIELLKLLTRTRFLADPEELDADLR